MLNEKLHEVISHEGVVTIVSWNNNEPHLACTWNSHINVTPDDRILIPAGGMQGTQKNVEQNNNVKISLGSKEVMGYQYPGTGFLIEGTAKFVESGSDFEMMKEKFPFLSRVIEITVSSAKQLI
ncbi:pyridoxamine 5'-phosphate oxidase family protein [Neobacillus sp. PS3-40]|uniref:pyridoxamine 5'-phosphate oxidase family protein n=1 Tax=Neobacillus sp. PS3-40 TaxID=3070679 RepID=UPI0027DEFC4B|nr:pyridoxamine 5'-phosphate oxidase family protein [Neobacillus sp. PS3-40]WML44536.1 pyridoxamine 5'-phosphate oxidase family protein [Neobacillus sp. PS3-40]